MSTTATSIAAAHAAAERTYVRFTVAQRIEHVAVMSLFTLLVLTGFPQKYASSGWAQGFVSGIGGVGTLRFIHRMVGFLFTAQTLVHFSMLAERVIRRKGPLTMVPNRRDFTDAIGTLKYYLGLQKHHPQYDRYDYRQKFEYWGMVMGSLVMVATGLMLLYPTTAASFLPGQFIPAAKVAHSNEGLMAMLVIVVWHLFNAHLSPDVFPADVTIFTGKISRERMEKEHGRELARIEGRPESERRE